ncbi:DUF3883 domain-containing protein [Mycobacterium nebraskense]|uniref:DUF3883 domain-containing protein n=1 Tax=Mycobacterium nebraskense TaxID=244292 RepID=UPI000A76FEBB|nr:DUF3883 domain-containing protein [Mycobacterium nebraskense]
MPTESPDQRVESLLADELESVRDDVRGGRVRHALRTLAARASAENLVRDQYAGRYPFELIQNANDAGGDSGVSGGTVAFTLTNTALIVADQGTGFGIDQVEAIYGFANSSKDPRKNIGYKGLGFKSVKEITSAPQIFAPLVQFGFDGPRAQQLVHDVVGAPGELPSVPHYAFPFRISPDDAGDDRGAVIDALDAGFTTVIRLPFKNEVSRDTVDQTLCETLHPQILLFLDHIDRLVVAGTSADFVATTDRDGGADCDEVLLSHHNKVDHFLVFRTERKIPDRKLVADLGGAWGKVEAVRLFAAVPLADDGLPTTEASEPLHVYFPTEEDSGLAIILNADFQLDAARLRIANAPNTVGYNGWLIDELAGFVADDVVPALLTRFENHPRVTAAVLYPEPRGSWPKRLRQALVRRLAESAFIPCADGAVRRPGEVNMLPWSVIDVAFFQTLLPNDTYRLVHADLDANGREHEVLRDDFAVEELDGGEMFADLNPPDEEMVTRYYEALVEWSNRAPSWESSWLGKTACVRLDSGEWAMPSEAFLPPRGEHHLPAGMSVPIADLPEVPGTEAMLKRAGLQTFGWRSVIIEYLVPILTNPEAEPAQRADAMSLLRDYHGSGGHDAAVEKEIGAVLLRAAACDGGEQTLVPAHHLYFSKEWRPDTDLTSIYGPFDQQEFLAEPRPDDQDLRGGEFKFFSWLGVEDKPRTFDLRWGGSDTSLPDYAKPSPQLDFKWQYAPGYQAASRCSQGHPRSQLLRSSPWIDRLDEIINGGDFAQLSTLWNSFGRHWSHYDKTLKAEFSCTTSAHSGARSRRFPSLVEHLLTSSAWVPALRNGGESLQVPGSLWHLPAGAPDAIADFLPVLAPGLLSKQSMCHALGIIDGDQPGARVMVEVLHRLNSEAEEAGHVTTSAKSIARWAMRKLDSVARDIPADEAQHIPVLARLDGSAVFDPRPYITSDRLAEETWQDLVPIYDGDRTARNLIDVLDLPVLEERVLVEVQAIGRDPIAEPRTVTDLETVMPQLLAAAGQLSPSLQVDISRKLNCLELACVQELSLQYQLDDEIRTAASPTSYIERYGGHRGTAYLALDRETGEVDWYSFASQLARHIDVEEAGDRFAILLTNPRGRSQWLTAHGISDADIIAAQELLSENQTIDEPAISDDVVETETPQPEPESGPKTDDETIEEWPAIDAAEGPTIQQDNVPNNGADARPPSAEGRTRQPKRNQSAENEPTVSKPSGSRGSNETPTDSQTAPSQREKRSANKVAAPEVNAVDESRPQGRFFSYVVPERSEVQSADPSESVSPGVNRAGVDRVLAYERAAGRDPQEQAHNNPGFDVASHHPDGSVARYIEIKSLLGKWAERGVAMSRRQARENADRGDDFWLYVVEFAMDDSRAKVLPIQNPMSKAGSFVFDSGWSAWSASDDSEKS